MATYTISSRLQLSGQGVSSDVLNQSNLQDFNVTQPTVESGALDVTSARQTLGILDGVATTADVYLYIKNTGLATQGDLYINVENKEQATAFISFTGNPANGGAITLISTDLTSKVYTAAAAENTATGAFISTGTVTAVATSLKNCIEASAGHAGKIAVAIDAGELTLTQALGGSAGNSTITVTSTNTVASNTFANGSENNSNRVSTLKSGKFAALPISANTDLSINSSTPTTCEYGWWSII